LNEREKKEKSDNVAPNKSEGQEKEKEFYSVGMVEAKQN
jgi:hypothetical protein